MKLSKAIEILTIACEADNFMPDQDYQDAQKLGIEALKREQHHRYGLIVSEPVLLPGETPENEK